jgi:cell division protein FtsI/penicillin-binding protein 2
MAVAYAALANGGTRFRPRLVKELVAPGGAVVRAWGTEAVARPLSGPVVVGPLRDALERVVSDPRGTARRARSERYRIAGKTGTTKLLVNGHYHEREVVASFCGFAPAEAPRLAFSVVVWGPSTAKEKKWGGTVAAPAAGKLAEQALVLLKVPPSPPPATEVAQER